MKTPAAILLCLFCCSCYDTDSDTSALNQRIIRLEQRMDSLTRTQNESTAGYTKIETSKENNRCQRVTKKGTQCKRKAKKNGYCWQHGG